MKIVILLFLLCSNLLTAQVSEEWTRKYNGPGTNSDNGHKIITDADGNYYLLSAGNGANSINDLLTEKYDNDGNMIWHRSYSYSSSSNDYPTDMRFDNSGNIIVVGNSEISDFNSDIVTLKYDTSGNQIWQRRYGNAGNTDDVSKSMFTDNNGFIYITGVSSDFTRFNLLTLKYDQNGNSIFFYTFVGVPNSNHVGNFITADNSGNAYVAGYVQENPSVYGDDYLIMKFSAGGNLIWGRTYNGIQDSTDAAYFVKTDISGNVYVSGLTYESGFLSNATSLKYDSNGNLIWDRTYTHSSISREVFINADFDDSNNLYLYLISFDNNSVFDVIIKYNENGDQIYVSDIQRPQGATFSYFCDFILDLNGSVYLSFPFTYFLDSFILQEQIYLIKLSPQGSVIYNNFLNIFQRSRSQVKSMAIDISGNIFITGTSESDSSGTYYDAMTLKFDASGNNVWEKYNLGEGSGSDISYAMIKDNDDNIYVTGAGSFGFYTSFITLKYKPDGKLIWKKIFKSSVTSSEKALDIAQDQEGNVIVTGSSQSSGNNFNILTVKYDSSGVEQWYKDFNGTGNSDDIPTKMNTDAVGNIYITGSSTGTGTGKDVITLKYDPNGNLIWNKIFNGSSNGEDIGNDLKLDNQNNVFVTGEVTNANTGRDGIVIKYDIAGNQIWVNTYTGQGNYPDLFKRIKVDSQNNIYTSGETVTVSSSFDYITVKYDNAGNQIWDRSYNGTSNSIDKINDMIIDNDFIYVTGESIGTGTTYDFLTIKYDLSGNEIWQKRFNGTESRLDVPRAITSDIAGNIYITGQSYSNFSNSDILTLKYDNSGNQIWNILFNGDGNLADNPSAVAVNKTGDVFVTGSVSGVFFTSDIITIKYSQTVGIQNLNISTPEIFKLYDNYPNPFNPATNIKFDIPVSSDVKLKIYDITGKEIFTAINAMLTAGTYEYRWNASNHASGVYFYKIFVSGNSSEFIKTKRMILLK